MLLIPPCVKPVLKSISDQLADAYVRHYCRLEVSTTTPLQWRHIEHDGVPNYQPRDCLLNRLNRRRSNKSSKRGVSGLCAENSVVNSPHKGPVTRTMFPFDDVIMPYHTLFLSPLSSFSLLQTLSLGIWYINSPYGIDLTGCCMT